VAERDDAHDLASIDHFVEDSICADARGASAGEFVAKRRSHLSRIVEQRPEHELDDRDAGWLTWRPGRSPSCSPISKGRHVCGRSAELDRVIEGVASDP
jgi:hypothetical protein